MATGTLNRAKLLCGYVETHDVADRYEVRLAMAGQEYHVKVRDNRLSLGLAAWEAYSTLTEARKAVAQAKKYYKGREDAEPVVRGDTAPWL